MSSVSKLDQVYRTILLSKYFTKGWGNPEVMKRLFRFRKVMSNRETCRHLVSRHHPISIRKVDSNSEYNLFEGSFVSPFVRFMGDLLPPECHTAHFQLVLPTKWKHEKHRPVCIHLAGTGDHYFWRRRTLMARPLVREPGIGSIILENPFYGTRKPKDYVRSNLHNVTDIFLMGGCLILECSALLHWCERNGLGPLGITGVSMGGHMASLAACNWPKPIALIPCLSWSSASGVFTQGVMSGAIDWSLLESQYCTSHEYRQEIMQMIKQTPQDAAFAAGREFVQRFPEFSGNMRQSEESSTNADDRARFSSFLSNFENPMHVLDSKHEYVPNYVSTSASPNPTSANVRAEMVKDNIVAASAAVVGTASAGEAVRKLAVPKPAIKATSETVKRWIGLGSKTSSSDSAVRLEALQFMRGIMDECTYIGNFTKPVDTSLIITVAATSDGYVPRGDGLPGLDDLWPSAEIRYVRAGHVAAFIFNQGVFRKAIVDSFDRLTKKYYS